MAWLIKRGPVYYIRHSVAGKKRKLSTDTDNSPLAHEKLRRFESAQARGESGLPTKTPIADMLTAYVAHVRSVKTAKSAQTDVSCASAAAARRAASARAAAGRWSFSYQNSP